MKSNSVLRVALLAASLTGLLLLDGCGRAGPPVPLDPTVAPRADAAEGADPAANTPTKLPRGSNDNSLKAGATKGATPFDFLL